MKEGDQYNGFIIKSVERIDEIHVTLIHAQHIQNGANIFHITADDKENLFGLCFKTYPTNDTGVPHILEHTVLCGSKKFPIHDPFFSMLRRSCNTFMNAFTSKLWTGYVASSQIEKDFYNIFSVYLDAVFNPLLTEESFMQEGHRVEFSDPENIHSPLAYKGIVFNEMKGVFSNPSSVVWRSLMSHLYPASAYGYDSGGLPKDITNLTHQELVDFHKKFYDKRRCNYFFYGDIPLTKHLDYLSTHLFNNKEEKIAQVPVVEKIKRFTIPKSFTAQYQSTNEKKDPTYFSLGFVTCGIESQEEALALVLLDTILMDTDASMLKKKILQSKLCSDLYSMYDTDAREIPYVIYCVGLKGKSEDLEHCILQAFEEIKQEGISDEWIESALHQIEFSKVEIAESGGPYGLDLMQRTLTPYQQGGDLSDGLKIHSLLHALREKLKNPKFLPNFIDKMVLKNTHRVSLTLCPDEHLAEKEKQQEALSLQEINDGFSQQDRLKLQRQMKAFRQYQELAENENINCLPSLQISDIPTEVPYYPISKMLERSSTIYHHDVFTNSIYYLDLVFDIPQIPEEDLPYLKLFSSIIPELGTKNCSWEVNMQRVQEYFGSLSSGLALNVQKDHINTCYPTLSISSRFLTRNREQCFQILKDTILNIDFEDEQRIKDLIRQIASSLESGINKRAMSYALKQSSAHISPWNHLGNLWYGAPYYRFIKDIEERLDENISIVIEKFYSFKKSLFHFNNAHIVISCEEKDFKKLQEVSFYDLMTLSDASSSFSPWIELPVPSCAENKGVVISSSIAHNALAIATVTLTSDLSPALKIATYLLENIYIHKMVREKGGAYGSGVKYNILTGVLHFYSSRDPHISLTIDAFLKGAAELSERDISDRELTEAILSYIQDVDSPVPVSCRASVTYFQEKVGLSKEVRQAFRDQVLSITKEDIKRAVKEAILPGLKSQATHVTYGQKDKIEEANTLLTNPLTIEYI